MKKCIIILLLILLWHFSVYAQDSDFQSHTSKGLSFLCEDGSWDEAIAEFEAALKISPDNAMAHYYLARARISKYIDLFNSHPNMARLQSIAKKENMDSTPLSELIKRDAELMEELNRKAIGGFKKALELDEKIWGAHYFLGTHYHNIGKLYEAEKELKRTIELNPEYSNSYAVLASVYEKLEKYDLAIDYHRKVLEFHPEYDAERVDLMLLYLKLGMEKEAFTEYDYLRAKK
jgi:tetratricopeptide (TPR) repeat protein